LSVVDREHLLEALLLANAVDDFGDIESERLVGVLECPDLLSQFGCSRARVSTCVHASNGSPQTSCTYLRQIQARQLCRDGLALALAPSGLGDLPVRPSCRLVLLPRAPLPGLGFRGAQFEGCQDVANEEVDGVVQNPGFRLLLLLPRIRCRLPQVGRARTPEHCCSTPHWIGIAASLALGRKESARRARSRTTRSPPASSGRPA
jgi:hypothetical protein